MKDKFDELKNFQRSQRFRFPNTPKRVKINVALGERYRAANGEVYEIIEKHGGLMVKNEGTGGESFVHTHDWSEYEKI